MSTDSLGNKLSVNIELALEEGIYAKTTVSAPQVSVLSPWLRRINSWGSSPSRTATPESVESSSTIVDGRAKSILSLRVGSEKLNDLIKPRQLTYVSPVRKDSRRNIISVVGSVGVISAVLFFWVKRIVELSMEDGEWWRFSQVVIFPAIICFLIFPALVVTYVFLNMFMSVG